MLRWLGVEVWLRGEGRIEISTFSGLMSLWKNPWAWMCCKADMTCHLQLVWHRNGGYRITWTVLCSRGLFSRDLRN